MRKIYIIFLSTCIVIAGLSILPGCHAKKENKSEDFREEEMDEYDGPDKAIEFEIERTKDLTTGKVPWDKFLLAIQQTEQAKQRSRSQNVQALSWTERGPNGDFTGGGNPRPTGQQTAGRIRAVMIDSLDPTHKTVLVGSVAGGLWRTTDITTAPSNWTLVNDFLSNLAVADLAQDPRPGFQNIVYMATGESYSNADAVGGVGVFKSTDDGATWNFLASTATFTAGTRIVCDQAGNVYWGGRTNGLQRSSDGGTTWTNITPAGIGTSVCDLEISNTGRMHVTTGIFSTSGYRFTDNPATVTAAGWISSTTPFTTFNQRTEIAVSGNTLIALPDNTAHQVPSIWKSTDGGDNWTVTAGQPSPVGTWASQQGWYSLSAAINPANSNEFVVGGLDTHKSSNGGTSWAAISSWATGTTGFFVHADQHDIQWWDGGTKMLMACDGGLYYSSVGGGSFSDRDKGLRIKQFYSVALHPLQANYMIGGAQDNGIHRLDHPGLDSSLEIVGGDGMFVAIDQNEPQFQFGAYVYNNFRRSINNGASWSSPIANNNGMFVNPWDYDDVNNKIYSSNAGGNYLRWNNPQTGNITEIVSCAEFTGGTVASVFVSPYTANRVYFGMSSGGRIVKVDNADAATTVTGTIITPAGANGYINSVVTGSDDQHLIATCTSSGQPHVWLSVDGGTTWVNATGNLPNMPVYWALFHPDSDTKAFIATQTGVWETDLLNGTSTIWNANPTFPTVRTDMLQYRASTRTIAAATHGRGMWTATVAPPTGFSFNTPAAVSASCPAPASMDVVLTTVSNGGFTNPISLTATGNPGGTTVSFVPSSTVVPGNNVTVRLTGTNTLAPGTYTITVTGQASGTGNQSVGVTYIITASGPAITTQPGNQTVCAGSNASFSVVSATATSFQWQVSTDGGNTWNNVPVGLPYSGITTNTLNITGVTSTLNGNRYRVLASTFCGTTTSSSGLLTVNDLPAITAQPVDATLCAGANNTFSVTATGAGLTYQWQLSLTGCAGPWNNITGATLSTYTLTNITAGQNNTAYRVIVSGTCTPPVTSNCALLSVITSVTITTQPVNQTVCEGSTAAFTTGGSGAGVIYQWQISTDAGNTWNNVPVGSPYSGGTTSTLSISPVTFAMNNYRYRALLTNATCTTPSTTNSAILTVNTLPLITTQPQNATICVGGSNTFTSAATGTGIGYQWQISTDGGNTWTNITGATTASYTVSAATLVMNNNRYRVVVTGTCAPVATSNAAILTVIAPVAITAQTANVEVCSGSNASFSVTANSTQTINYQWQVSTDGGNTWTNIAGATSATYTVSSTVVVMNGNRYRVQLTNSACTTPTISNVAILTVRQLPGVGLSASPLTTLLPGQTTTLTATPSASTGGTLTSTWNLNGTVFTNAGNTYVADITKLGSYQVKIQEAWPSGLVCFNESPIVIISAGISTKLFIYPSPNDGQFTVSYYNSAGTGTSRTITVYDSKGSKVYFGKFSINGPYTLIPIDVRPAQTGIYYVMVRDANAQKLAEGKVLVH